MTAYPAELGAVKLELAQEFMAYGPTLQVEYIAGAGVASSGTPTEGDEITGWIRQVRDPQPGVSGSVFVAPSKWILTTTHDTLYHATTKPGGLAQDRVVRDVATGKAFRVASVDDSQSSVVTCDLEITG
jgi:hypothetical protein